ncbi:hypothetical protein [Comamonas aquatica]|uniref:hypothetical protein n=1 Tax=Comamonas aquatica TaxID=225991 RepID=UPI00244C3473|nr:hypothetical protein [Comamonas aquatica]MDH0494244.1 hypothetical protein [Comamonas aquatica]
MPHQIGFVEAGGGKLAHQKMLEVVATFAATHGWAVLRFDDTLVNHELILKAPGLSGEEEIFMGLRCYQNANADYYNLTAAAFLGYVPSNSFAAQPGAQLSGVPAHNNRIDYWLTINGQRLVLAMKVGTPAYEALYIGKMLPYARPTQYAYPMVVGGMLNGEPATRFSDTSHSIPFKGDRTNLKLWFIDGLWKQPLVYPWSSYNLTTARQIRDTGGYYPLMPCQLHFSNNLVGELDGVYQVSGFNSAVENTLMQDGVEYVVIQDVARNGFVDYFAMRLDA